MPSVKKTALHRGKAKDNDNDSATFPHGVVPLLLNRRQACAYLGVGRDRLRAYERHKAFPAPLRDSPPNKPMWLRDHLETFVRLIATEGPPP
jgi:hypothetical protein